jgi:hypothetical protein
MIKHQTIYKHIKMAIKYTSICLVFIAQRYAQAAHA